MQFLSGKLIVVFCLAAVVVACSLQLLVSGQGDGSSSQESAKERRWLQLYHKGQLISIAYIDPRNVRPITEERREMELSVLQTFKALNNQTAHDAFIKRKSYVMLIPNLMSSIGDLIQARCDYQLLPESGKFPALTKEFSGTIYAMWKFILHEGDKAWEQEVANLKMRGRKPKKSTESERVAIVQQLNDFSDLAIAVIEASPVGLFLDWSTLYIDHHHIGYWAGPIVTFCRRDGFNPVIGLANMVVNYIKDIEWGGENTPKLIDAPMMMLGSFMKCNWKQPDGTVLRMTISDIRREQKKRAKRAERERFYS